MVPKLLTVFIGQALVFQIITANLHNLHPALQQYIISLTQPTPSISYPSVSVTKHSTPNLQSLAALATLLGPQSYQPNLKSQAVSPSSILAALSSDLPYSSAPSSANLNSLATLAALLGSPPPSTPKPQVITSSPSNLLSALASGSQSNAAASNIDASLLNNLAIALQLLLVSNMLNTPTQETTPEPIVVPGYPVYESKEPVTPVSVSYAHTGQQSKPVTATTLAPSTANYITNYEQPIPNSNYNHYETVQNYQPPMPNANFVGSSNFGEGNPFGGTVPPPSTSSSRGGFSLMSPYEALSPSSPYLDPILSSPFGSVMTSKKDFQSPYTTIMAAENKDLFSFSDFF